MRKGLQSRVIGLRLGHLLAGFETFNARHGNDPFIPGDVAIRRNHRTCPECVELIAQFIHDFALLSISLRWAASSVF